MGVSRARVTEIARAIVHEARVEKLTFMAGSIAYHAFISILPLLLLIITIVQRTQSVVIRDSITSIMRSVLTDQAGQIIQQGFEQADASVSILGVVFLVWGALRIFRGLDTAFSDIYETEAKNTFADQISDGLVLLGTVTLAVVSASVIGNLFAITGSGLLSTVLRNGVTAVGLFVVFFPMYYIFPDTDLEPIEVVPGTAFAAVGIMLAQAVFTTFKGGSAGQNLIASILVLLTWLYIIGLVILIGVVINAVLANRSKDVDIEPVFGGVPRRRGASGTRVDRDDLLESLDELVEQLETTDEPVRIQVNGQEVAVVRPQTSSIDRSSTVFGLDDSVGLTLRWWPDGEEDG
jgi:membrane protein